MDNDTSSKLPVISREGMRKQRTRTSILVPDRLRKSTKQVDYLRSLYSQTGGKLDRKQRKRAMKATGLSWIQIYKWLFDKQMKETEKRSLTQNTIPMPIFRVIGRDGKELGKPVQIFKIEKVVRSSM